jgi:UDP-3-O-[3-hydroxymyristoyl] N-acetylglucosamine deacetylase
MLDAIGDLALAGAPLLGSYRTVHGGHKLNYAVLSALMADTSAWTLTEGEPVWPTRSHADLSGGLMAPVFAPDVS